MALTHWKCIASSWRTHAMPQFKKQPSNHVDNSTVLNLNELKNAICETSVRDLLLWLLAD